MPWRCACAGVALGAAALRCSRTCVPVGASDEASEGALDGASEGASEGALDGASEGASEGALDGASEGASEGALDGTSDGASDGALEGALDGAVASMKPLGDTLRQGTRCFSAVMVFQETT